MTESIADIRRRGWQTRRKKYGPRGHSGSYGSFRPVFLNTWNGRLRSMQDMLIKLYRQGTLSEGQVSKATGIDRVSCRELAIQQQENERKNGTAYDYKEGFPLGEQ